MLQFYVNKTWIRISVSGTGSELSIKSESGSVLIEFGSLSLACFNLFQMGLLQGQHREQRNNIQQEVDNIRGNEEGAHRGNEEGAHPNIRGNQDDETPPATEPEEAGEEEEDEPDVFTFVTTFILTFFSSLIPDNNQAVIV